MNNVVTTLAPSFLIGSSSFLQETSKPEHHKNLHRLTMGDLL